MLILNTLIYIILVRYKVINYKHCQSTTCFNDEATLKLAIISAATKQKEYQLINPQ